jgi:hypothetical protein
MINESRRMTPPEIAVRINVDNTASEPAERSGGRRKGQSLTASYGIARFPTKQALSAAG